MVTHPFPYLLKQERNRRRWSQQDLANALKVSRVTVSRWETGEHRPIPYWRERICKLFNKETEEFFRSHPLVTLSKWSKVILVWHAPPRCSVRAQPVHQPAVP